MFRHGFRPYGLIVFCLVLAACTSLPSPVPRPANWAQPAVARHVKNLYRVDEGLYRSAQPDAAGMRELESLGIKTVLDLRLAHSDQHLMRGTSLRAKTVPMAPSAISSRQLRKAVRLIRESEKPVLVHCLHGADRTGAVIAAYRIAEQGWSREEAVREMRRGGYGHHYLMFPNIREILLHFQPATSQ